MEYSVLQARDVHIEQMSKRVRASDITEVRSAFGVTVEDGMAQAISLDGLHFTWLVDGRPEAMFGCAASDKGWERGVPWLIATPMIEKHKVNAMRQCKRFTALFKKQFMSLENYVMATNMVSIKWLRCLGYTIDHPVQYGVMGDYFRRFHWSRS